MNNRVGIITVNFNQNDYTKKCIDSLLNSNYKFFEIILIDNGSSAENYQHILSEYSNKSSIIIIRIDKNVGYVKAINTGLQYIKNKKEISYILILNNDTVIDKYAIENLINTSQKYQDNIITSGKIYHYDKKNILQYIGQRYHKNILSVESLGINEIDRGQYEKEIELDMLDDIYWLFSRKILDSIGYYSRYFYLYGEQTDYALRAKKRGVKLIYTPKAKLYHKGSITTGDGDRQAPAVVYWRNIGVLKNLYLHENTRTYLGYYFKLMLFNTIRLVIKIFTRRNVLKEKIRIKAGFMFFLWLLNKQEDNGYNPYIKLNK